MDHPMSDYLSTWYSPSPHEKQGTTRKSTSKYHAIARLTVNSNFAFPAAQLAFQEGLNRFASDLTKDSQKVSFSKGFSSIKDVEALACDSFAKYSDEKRFPKAKKWLQRINSKIHHYGNVMDVLVQHHPEYVSLAWGAMKLVLVVSPSSSQHVILRVADESKSAQNHEATICLISKALSQIADSLPRVELVMVLYPTDRIRQAVSNLYANLVRFFIRAHEWCQEGKLRHLLHSITRPPELRYQDLLEDITVNSREIDQLAAASARVEIRDISLKLNSIAAKLDSFQSDSSSAVIQTNQNIIARLDSLQVLQSSALLDTNQRLSDLQFSQIMSHIQDGKLGDPLEAFRYNVSVQIRHDRVRVHETTNEFWQSPKLQVWSTAPEPRVAIVKGGLRARHASRKFCVNIIQQLQSKNIPVVWALRGPQNDSQDGPASSTDLFKHLILQAFKLSQNCTTESVMSLQCAQFHRANVEQDWLQLLGSALLRARTQIYLIIDLVVVDHNLLPSEGFSWFTAFQSLFAEIAKRAPRLQVKVLLLGNSVSFVASEHSIVPSDVVIPVKVTQTPVRRRRKIESRVEAYRRKENQLF
ncbi:hypothetical protein FLAG1_09866 [Fusarium langsethiae]|uniref:DUF7708 domain-containing protein n=1 Tax=Fusarium langsethiae TaxID=179993 RepID=A0A0M9EPM5_FUSLA|nr:hypothetical protein FLAG1_09866 [Fusarium langsethiae]GKU06987.1 unnamed protein product [Fusarium langsethiae]GKU22260.1 unnamed protein product [Fusarium langsethiae]